MNWLDLVTVWSGLLFEGVMLVWAVVLSRLAIQSADRVRKLERAVYRDMEERE